MTIEDRGVGMENRSAMIEDRSVGMENRSAMIEDRSPPSRSVTPYDISIRFLSILNSVP